MAVEVLVPLYRVTEYKDGFVFRTEPAGERWIPLLNAIPGREIEPDLRIGTPDGLILRDPEKGIFHNPKEG